ncbi:hypothetical protein JKP75_13190 [Blastococcus sp. TML/M2B]|uniref:hypothetical protein n=1 Tax=unclassified Blastococcus TaxID=2619396 RepID=UPI00190E3BD6|nr:MULTISPECIES: hypothetical protein [unclassified Blastococcus]MBN1093432.1 hypothetical protein [Blastococcus sp. TML/M2B]MBN1096450.1 hypothetical protein [Blastococcus sp. TML/C7B]
MRYELKTVKAIRGTEGRSVAKWQKDGWELVDQSAGTLHTTLNFRKPKPPLPVRQIAIAGAAVLVLAGVIGVGALLEGNGDSKNSASATSTSVTAEESDAPPAAEPTEQVDAPPAPVATEPVDTPPTPVTDTTVDELLDALNAGSSSGIATGDRFRITAELFESDAWGVGASGDFVVYVMAKGGADDLPVFVDESDADGWQNGTRVEMVVEAVEATINGETTDGWLQAESVKTASGA